MEWQPIETAPGSDVLVLLWWAGTVEIAPARYDDGTIVWAYDEWANSAGKVVSPTHWMPLPNPPAPPPERGDAR